MSSSRFYSARVFTLGAILGGVMVVAATVLLGVVARFDNAVGPVVIRSQAGTYFPLPVPEDGLFRSRSEGVPPAIPGDIERPTNVILVIGDGMGLGTVSSSSALLFGPAGGLVLESAPVTGFMRTYASDALVTDSAAAATAMATGFKTNRKMISMLPDGRIVPTLFERARALGYRTGVVTTSGLMDATPAGFTAHNVHRDNYTEILIDQLGSGTDVMIGAAWGRVEGFDPELDKAFSDARDRGVTFVTSGDQLETAAAPLIALFPPRPGLPDAGGPPLEVSVRKALTEISGHASGFMLLVESEETDERAHDNDVGATVAAVAELDAALREIVRFAQEHDDTLVIVTGDHDTAGMALVRGRPDEARAKVRWVTDSHAATWAPVFAFGPGAESFSGVFDNTEIGLRVAFLLSL